MSEVTGDIIEISDESSSEEDSYDEGGPSNLQGVKRKSTITISDSEDEEDVVWCEEESESEPETECDLWDEDCVVSDMRPKRKLITGFHLMPTCSKNPEEDIKQQRMSINLNEIFTSEEYFTVLKDNFNNNNAYEDKNSEILRDPWKVLVLNNILSQPSILDDIRQEFYEASWNRRNLDLYEFFQTKDLKHLSSKYLNLVHEFLKTELKEWVEKLVGLEFYDVSATCSFYSHSDFLSVHDDQNDDRAVAFVLYLTGREGWSVDWGGSLQLFERDGNDQPKQCARNIIPRNNQLVLFPVSDHSYHQVEEVTCQNFCRLSINGWFHTKESLIFNSPSYTPPKRGFHSDGFYSSLDKDIDIQTWTNYEADSEEILDTLEEQSEISLESFFHEDKLKELTEAIDSSVLKWERVGPPNRLNYETLADEEKPEILNNFIGLFESSDFFNYISTLTGVQVKKMKWDLQKWTPGSYCLINEQNRFELDLIVYFGDVRVVGATTHYVTLEEEIQTALLSLTPATDCLNIVYSDTPKYVSHYSKSSKSDHFYMFIASYIE